MKHSGSIQGRRVEASHDYIVYSDECGLVAECATLELAQRVWEFEERKCKERGMEPHLAIFGWSVNCWSVPVSLYELMERELRKHPSGAIDFP